MSAARHSGDAVKATDEPVLVVEDVAVHFAARGGFLAGKAPPVRAVEGVSLTLNAGETLGLWSADPGAENPRSPTPSSASSAHARQHPNQGRGGGRRDPQ